MGQHLLKETKVKAAKPTDKPYKLSDGGGLCLLVTPEGGRLWRLRYRQPGLARIDDKGVNRGRPESMVSLGSYPEISLIDAREKAAEYRKGLVKHKVTPADAKRAEQAVYANTFKEVALEWLDKQRFREKTRVKADWTFNDLLFPHIGSKPVAKLTALEILEVLRRLEERGKHETAHRTKQRVSQVIRYAIATGRRIDSDPTVDLRGALTPIAVENHASIKDPAGIGELLRAIDGYKGQPATEAALKLAPLLFVRPGELRAAEWFEFTLDGDEPMWRIPGPRMKMKKEHLVPLAPHAVAILRGLQPFTGYGKYVFPSLRSRDRPMSENAITAALRRMGYDGDQMTWHGFRSMASTRLNEATENGRKLWDPDWIERQLAHVDGGVRGDYNAAEYIGGRRAMLEWWADYLDGLKAGGNVVAFNSKARA
jgi:integrase